MSIIRYRFKADKNFESVKIDGMSCSLGELKRLIAAKSSRSGSYYPKDDYDLIISNANTHEEYKDNSDLIPRNASVIVARRIRGTVDTLTPSSHQRPVVSSDDIVKDILLPAILNQTSATTTASTTPTSSSITTSAPAVEPNATTMKKVPEPNSNTTNKEMTEDELIKEIQMGSQARYVTPQPAYRTNLFVCHNCKQPGHIKSQCPLMLQSSSSNTSGSNSGTSSSTTDAASSTNSNTNSARPSQTHSSHIVTRHAPYPMSYHHRGNRSHRGAGHPRGEPQPKKTTGIPRDRLIPVPKHIPGALRDQTGASVVPKPMAELFVARMGKKESLNQSGQYTDEKSVSSSTPSSRSTDNEPPPNDLLCPLCKRVYVDAVITPCCNLSFCDECIRTPLIESPEHECPYCHCQHVAIDQINPNLYLRNHIRRWHEGKAQPSYSTASHSQPAIHTPDQDIDTTSTNAHNLIDVDEYDPTVPQPPIIPVKTAPIIIKMQPPGKNQSPPPPPPAPIVSTRPADMTFEDEKVSDIDHIPSSQKDGNTNEELIERAASSTPVEPEKSERGTPSSQVAPVNTIYSSPTLATTMAPTNPVIPHYYSVPQHPNVMYPHHISPAASNGLYPVQPNYYPPPMGVRYPPAAIHPYPPFAGPAPPIHHPPAPHPPPPPIVAPPHIPTNGYNMPNFHPHAAVPYTSTSTFIAHHQTATQPISTALSENEFYIKQRYFQRIQRSPSHRRSRSSSYSSYSSSDSRSSSRSRSNRRRRSSRSRSRHRVKSPVRDNRRQRRSSSYRSRRRPIDIKEKHSSKYRRSPPRPSRDNERRRSPRPPPTIQQSTQRTIVYLQESSHSSRDRRRTKSRSHENDDRLASSSKKEHQPQPESKLTTSNSPLTRVPTTLSSKIETVVEETLEKVQEESSKNGKKHKKHKKHRHSSSKSKKRHRSKDKEKKTIVDTTTSVIEIHS